MKANNNYLQYLQVINCQISLVSPFILLPGPDGGLYGVLFDNDRKDVPLDDSVNVISSFWKSLSQRHPVGLAPSSLLNFLFVG